ncbi:hypothetical protein VQ062_29845 [Pseudomonas sp. KBN10P05918]|uniref:hypothetical protein n=1 Tax=Pseudomonas sp. KBN10P05918 TaxID=3113718 RepID=UPI003097984F
MPEAVVAPQALRREQFLDVEVLDGEFESFGNEDLCVSKHAARRELPDPVPGFVEGGDQVLAGDDRAIERGDQCVAVLVDLPAGQEVAVELA